MLERIYQNARTMQKNTDDYYQKMAFYEFSHRLPELLLMRVDKMTMAHSLEARVPFLDSRLVEFTMTIPPDKKMPPNATTKYLLKKAVEPILPHDIIYRKKQGFAAPMAEWLRGPWFASVQNTIVNSPLVTQGILNKNMIDSMLSMHKEGKKNYGKSIYSIMNLALWYKRFIQ
jgi:asparagine synthase (glutamine-hydrolysing)